MPAKSKLKKTTRKKRSVTQSKVTAKNILTESSTPRDIKFSVPRVTSIVKFIQTPRGVFSLIVVVLGLFAFMYKGLFIAAEVDGKLISRLSVVRELEKQSGKQALEALVTEALIEKAAEDRGVTVSQEEIDTAFTELEQELEAQGQNLEQVLLFQGMERTDLEKKIRIQKMLEALVSDSITITDEDITTFLSENSTLIPEDLPAEEHDDYAKEMLEEQKMSEEIQNLIPKLTEDASVRYFVEY